MRVLVIIPTYNEAENIGDVIGALGDAVPEADVLVVDDSSPDGTAALVEELAVSQLAAVRQSVHLLSRPGKSGLGSAYLAGFAWGIERGHDVLVEMDADLSHDPAALPSLLAEIERGADLVIGSRYVAGGAIPDWTWHRRALSRWGNRYASAMLRLPVADATAGYRAYRADLLQRIDRDSVRAEGYGFQIEMTDRAVAAGATVREVPITFTDRVKGRSKMSRAIVVEALALITRWGVTRRLSRRAPRR